MNLNDFKIRFSIDSWQESEVLEWKTSTKEIKEIVRTAAAFANTRGGHIIVGVKDDGSIVGQETSDSNLREIAQTLLGNTEEKISFSVQKLEVDQKQIIIIEVRESPLKPHLAYGRALKRVASTVVNMEQSEYHLLLGQKLNGGGADRDLCPAATIDDISSDKVAKFLSIANERRSTNFNLLSSTQDILQSLELQNAGVLNKGAVLLFGHNPQKFMPQAELRLAHFSSEDKNTFLAQKIVGGDLFSQLEEGLQFVKDRIPEKIETLKEGSRSVRVPPLAVYTELLANALVHRDYRDGAATYLNIVGQNPIKYVEILNPGALPQRLLAENMHLDHPSLPHNRRIARVFFLAGIIEQWGQGTVRAARLLLDAGLAAPTWLSQRGTVGVKFAI